MRTGQVMVGFLLARPRIGSGAATIRCHHGSRRPGGLGQTAGARSAELTWFSANGLRWRGKAELPLELARTVPTPFRGVSMTLAHCLTSSLALLALAPALQAQLPAPLDPPGNPSSPEKQLLGKALFFEEQLSSNRTVACGTCHDPLAGGADPRFSAAAPDVHPGPDLLFGTADDAIGSRSLTRSTANGLYRFHQQFGLEPQVTRRQTGGTFTAAYSNEAFWDGRASDELIDPLSGQTVLPSGAALEVQALEPILSASEMGHEGRTWAEVTSRLEQSTPLALAEDLGALGTWINGRDYGELFDEAFGTPDITPVRIAMALASYQRSVVPTDTPVDPLLASQPHDLTAQEMEGGTLFRTPATDCVACHAVPEYFDRQFHYTGVRPQTQDPGRFAVTGDPSDMGKILTPSLRNVEFTAPYFSDGRFATLEEVVDFYDRGGDFDAPNKHPLIRPLGLTPSEKTALVVYLKLPFSDKRMVLGQAPFDRPTLYGGSPREPQAYGQETDGTGGFFPRMIALEPALAGGGPITLGIEGGLGGAPGLLVVSPAADVAGTPFQGAVLHIALVTGLERISTPLDGSGPGAGWGSLQIDPPPIGVSLYAQWLVFDQVGQDRFSSTRGVMITGF